MYNDAVKVCNKIIKDTDLLDIFSKMYESGEKYKKISESEEMKNKVLDYSYQSWEYKDYNYSLKFNVNFSDNTSITFDNYNGFIGVFNQRINEIKYIYVYFSWAYWKKSPISKLDMYSGHISMYIYEHKMDVDVSLSSKDGIMDSVYELIKSKVLSAEERYDNVVRCKNKITNKVTFSKGFIPSAVICSLLLIIPEVREICAITYFAFPVVCSLLSYMIGNTLFGGGISSLYENIVPQKKYAGYDRESGTSIYKDDVDDFVNKAEIIIGKNIHNLENREKIREALKGAKKMIPYEIIVLVVLSVVSVLLGKFL